jgi:hypothetical protein
MSNRPRAINEPRAVPEREVIAALDRFRAAETKLEEAEREYDDAAGALAEKLKAARWPVMMVTRR